MALCCSWWTLIFTMVSLVNSQYATGSLGDYSLQKMLVLYNYRLCFSKVPHLSLRNAITHGLICMKDQFEHCVMKNPVGYSQEMTEEVFRPLSNSRYCGSLWVQENPVLSFTVDVMLEVTETHNIHLVVLHFYFSLSIHISCHQHGLVLRYPGFQSETYCGSRVPWDLITRGYRLFIRLVTTEYKKYSIALYYSSFHTRWISELSRIFKIYQTFSSGGYVTKPFHYFYRNIQRYHYYVMSNQDKYLEFYASLTKLYRAHIRIYDGPGVLSRMILESKQIMAGVLLAETSAFLARVDLFIPDFSGNSSVWLDIIASSNKRRISSCINYEQALILAKSDNQKNTACVETLAVPDDFMRIDFVRFRFSGPNTFTDSVDTVCHYGGLVIQFDGRRKQHEFCEDVDDFIIYTGQRSISVILVWFSGYSHGELSAKMAPSDCRVSYADIDLSRKQLSNPNIIVQSQSLVGCMIFICPALQNEYQQSFTVKLGPPAMGTTRLTILISYTLSACDYDHLNIHSNREFRIRLKTVSSHKWPFNLANNVSQTLFNFTRNIEKNFDYLQNATISLPYLCHRDMSRAQFSIVVQVSSCLMRSDGISIKKYIVNNMPALMNICLKRVYYFTPSAKPGKHSYEDFIYMDSGHLNDGHVIIVDYHTCPTKCRNYKYSAFVRSVDKETILEYTAHVGSPISTPRHHRGFRVSMLAPTPPCDLYLRCELLIFVQKQNYNITEQVSNFENITFFFHHKR